MTKSKLVKTTSTILAKSFKKETSENIFILCSTRSIEAAQFLFTAANKLSKKVYLIQSNLPNLFEDDLNGAANLWASAGLTIIVDQYMTPTQLSHLLKKMPESNILCINARNEKTFTRWLHANHNEIVMRTHKIADIFSIGRQLHLKTPDGTDLEMSLKTSRITADAGTINGHGTICSLPAGEVKVIGKPETINGKITVNFIAGHKRQDSQAQLLIKSGCVKQIRGKSDTAELLRKELKKLAPAERLVSQISFGTNDAAIFGKSRIEDQKVLGSAGVSLGCTVSNGQSNKITGILLGPTVYIDGRKIVTNGDVYLA